MLTRTQRKRRTQEKVAEEMENLFQRDCTACLIDTHFDHRLVGL